MGNLIVLFQKLVLLPVNIVNPIITLFAMINRATNTLERVVDNELTQIENQLTADLEATKAQDATLNDLAKQLAETKAANRVATKQESIDLQASAFKTKWLKGTLRGSFKNLTSLHSHRKIENIKEETVATATLWFVWANSINLLIKEPIMANQFENNKDYAGINLEVMVNGKFINLGSLFVTNKGATKVSKQLYQLLDSGALEASDITVQVSGIFSSDNSGNDLDASAFKS